MGEERKRWPRSVGVPFRKYRTEYPRPPSPLRAARAHRFDVHCCCWTTHENRTSCSGDPALASIGVSDRLRSYLTRLEGGSHAAGAHVDTLGHAIDRHRPALHIWRKRSVRASLRETHIVAEGANLPTDITLTGHGGLPFHSLLASLPRLGSSTEPPEVDRAPSPRAVAGRYNGNGLC